MLTQREPHQPSAPLRKRRSLLLTLALTARSLLDLSLVLSASARARGLRSCFLACRPLYLLALVFICNVLRICHLLCQSFLKCDFQNLEALQLGELLHQLLHAMLLKLYCNLRIIPITFATKHDSLPILRVPDPRSLLQPGLSRGLRSIQFRPRNLLPSSGKETRYIVD